MNTWIKARPNYKFLLVRPSAAFFVLLPDLQEFPLRETPAVFLSELFLVPRWPRLAPQPKEKLVLPNKRISFLPFGTNFPILLASLVALTGEPTTPSNVFNFANEFLNSITWNLVEFHWKDCIGGKCIIMIFLLVSLIRFACWFSPHGDVCVVLRIGFM